MGTGNPFPCPHTSPGREPGDCGNKGHPAIRAAPHTRHRLSLPVSKWGATSQSPSLRWGLLLRHAGRTGSRASPLARLRGRRDGHGQPRPLTLSPIKAPWREPGDCGNKGQPAIHAAPHTRHRLSLAVSKWGATSQSPSLRWGLLLRHAGRTGSRASPLARLRGRRDWHGQPSYKPRGASPGTAGIKATPLSMPPHIHDTV